MPTFNGSAIFGDACEVATADQPASVQVNSYPGVNGVEVLVLGDRGLMSEVRGELYGPSPAAIGQAMRAILRLCTLSTPGTFYDEVMDASYPESWLSGFAWTGPTCASPSHGWARSYKVTVNHPSNPSD